MPYKSMWTIYIMRNDTGHADEWLIREFKDKHRSANCALTEHGKPRDEIVWREAEVDLRNFSKSFPAAAFGLYWLGEDGEQGGYHAQDGKICAVIPEIKWPIFDPSKLK